MARTTTTTSPRQGLLLGALLTAAFAVLTWLVIGPVGLDRIDDRLNRDYGLGWFENVLRVVDRIGQRAVCLPILAAVVAWVVWKHRNARPILVAFAAVFALNSIMWALKIWFGRGGPLEPPALNGFFTDGQMYPSGHTGNVVLVYGLMAYLIRRYTDAPERVKRALPWVVAGLSVVMFFTSLLLRWHWASDLWAGYLVGGLVLSVAVAVDRAVPFQSRALVVAPTGEPHPRAGREPVAPSPELAPARTRPGAAATANGRMTGTGRATGNEQAAADGVGANGAAARSTPARGTRSHTPTGQRTGENGRPGGGDAAATPPQSAERTTAAGTPDS